MMNSKDYDFSFSGLKTAVLYAIRDKYGETPLRHPTSLKLRGTKGSAGSQHFVSAMCVEIQQAIIDVLLKKTLSAAKTYKAKTIILGGGVSANAELRKQFNYKLKAKSYNLNLLIPPANLSTDNALMIAVGGFFHRTKKIAWQKLSVNANLRIGK
jgi:N6-L-threonylcarbamoyladenine synthase